MIPKRLMAATLALAAAGGLAHQRRARALDCGGNATQLSLASVTIDDLPATDLSAYDGSVTLWAREPGTTEITVRPQPDRESFWRESFHAPSVALPAGR